MCNKLVGQCVCLCSNTYRNIVFLRKKHLRQQVCNRLANTSPRLKLSMRRSYQRVSDLNGHANLLATCLKFVIHLRDNARFSKRSVNLIFRNRQHSRRLRVVRVSSRLCFYVGNKLAANILEREKRARDLCICKFGTCCIFLCDTPLNSLFFLHLRQIREDWPKCPLHAVVH